MEYIHTNAPNDHHKEEKQKIGMQRLLWGCNFALKQLQHYLGQRIEPKSSLDVSYFHVQLNWTRHLDAFVGDVGKHHIACEKLPIAADN
jgi:hypothetical protein